MSPITSTLANSSAYGYRSFAAAGAGSFESIATITASGSSPSVTFSSIPTTYVSLQIRLSASVNYGSFNNSTANIYFNGDTTNANYISHNLRGDGSTATSSSTAIPRFGYVLDATSPVNIMSGGIIDIHNYTSATQNKVFRTLVGFNSNQGTGSTERIGLYSGLWLNTTAISSITLTALDGNWGSTSIFSLYGIKGA
jgi:hypothetical protein